LYRRNCLLCNNIAFFQEKTDIGLEIAFVIIMVQCSTAFVDSTLREGEQTPGVVLSPEEKILIAESLVDAGITELEAGIPAMGQSEVELLKSLRRLKARIICWCRAHPLDVDAALKAETGAVHISLPVSECLLSTMGRSWDWVMDQLETWSSTLGQHTDFFSVGAMDASRCSDTRLAQFTAAAVSAGYGRVRIADTLGLALPSTVRRWAGVLKPSLGYLEFHGHNDLGMAVANTVTALEEGFSAVSMTLLGLGERAGNAALEEVLLAAGVGLGLDTGVNLEKICLLAGKTAVMTGSVIPENKPLMGERINSHESGIHVAGLLKDPLSFKPFDPVPLGGPGEKIIWGRHSGRRSLVHLLETEQMEFCEGLIETLLDEVRRMSESLKRGLSRMEVMGLYKKLLTAEGVC